MAEFNPSKVYLAGRLDTGEGDIASWAEELEAKGHVVLEKWWEQGRLPKPYLEHMDSSQKAARAMIEAAARSDVMMLFPTDDILGAAVELGAALGSAETNSQKEIIIVNPWEVRQSVFYAHPAVTAVHGLAEVRAMKWYKGRNV